MIRPLRPEADAAGVVELIHEAFPASTATVENWLHQESTIPERARQRAWVAIADGVVAGRGEAVSKWFSDSGAAYANVTVGRAFRGRGLGAELWERVESHLAELAPTHVTTMFVETPESVTFATARGFEEARAETLSCVEPASVSVAAVHDGTDVVPLADVDPAEVYAVDMETSADVPATDMLNDLPFEEWLELFWRRPAITLDGSFGAVVDGRVASFTLLAANLERGRAFTEYTATLRDYRGRGLAERVKRASLAWAAAQGIRAAWTTNDETNAAMLSINERLGYTTRLRRVEYIRRG